MRTITVVLLLLLWLDAPGLRAQAPSAKSPGRATVYSVLATVLPTAAGIALVAGEDVGDGPVVAAGILGAVGIGLGPSAGHLYAGRTGLLLPRILVTGTLVLLASQSDDWDTGEGLLIAAAAAATTMAIIDIARADNAARAWNAEHGAVSVWAAPLPRAGGIGLAAGASLRF